MAVKMGELEVTATTEVDGKTHERTRVVPFPMFEKDAPTDCERLANLIEYFGAREVYTKFIDSWKIVEQNDIRNEIKRELKGENGTSKRGKGLKGVGL